MSRLAEKMPTSYAEAIAMLKGKSRVAIANDTFLHIDRDATVTNAPVYLRYHATDIAAFFPNGNVRLYTGGWHTATTLSRLRPIARALGFILAKRDGEVTLAAISEPRNAFRFFEGLVLAPHTMDADALRVR